MKTLTFVPTETCSPLASACRYCRFYSPVGRRGGTCQVLGVSVQADWKGCHLSMLQFTPSGETAEKIVV